MTLAQKTAPLAMASLSHEWGDVCNQHNNADPRCCDAEGKVSGANASYLEVGVLDGGGRTVRVPGALGVDPDLDVPARS